MSLSVLLSYLERHGETITYKGNLFFTTSANRRFYRTDVFLGPKDGKAWAEDVSFKIHHDRQAACPS